MCIRDRNNDIMKFLNIEDKDIIISKILIDGNTKIIYLEKTLKAVSYTHLDVYKRQILQDGYQLKLIVTQRKWRCTNPQCNLYFNDQFNFISKYKQSSNLKMCIRDSTYSVLYLHATYLDASPKAISGRTSYLRVRLEFHP